MIIKYVIEKVYTVHCTLYTVHCTGLPTKNKNSETTVQNIIFVSMYLWFRATTKDCLSNLWNKFQSLFQTEDLI